MGIGLLFSFHSPDLVPWQLLPCHPLCLYVGCVHCSRKYDMHTWCKVRNAVCLRVIMPTALFMDSIDLRAINFEPIIFYLLYIYTLFQSFCYHPQAVGVEAGWFNSWLLQWCLDACLDTPTHHWPPLLHEHWWGRPWHCHGRSCKCSCVRWNVEKKCVRSVNSDVDDDIAGCSTNQVATEMAASLLLSTYLHANALLCGKLNKLMLCVLWKILIAFSFSLALRQDYKTSISSIKAKTVRG